MASTFFFWTSHTNYECHEGAFGASNSVELFYTVTTFFNLVGEYRKVPLTSSLICLVRLLGILLCCFVIL
jgi:hypothetical protein